MNAFGGSKKDLGCVYSVLLRIQFPMRMLMLKNVPRNVRTMICNVMTTYFLESEATCEKNTVTIVIRKTASPTVKGYERNIENEG